MWLLWACLATIWQNVSGWGKTENTRKQNSQITKFIIMCWQKTLFSCCSITFQISQHWTLVNELWRKSTGLFFVYCVCHFNSHFCEDKIQTNFLIKCELKTSAEGLFFCTWVPVSSEGCPPLEEISGSSASSALVWARLVLGDSASWQSSGSWQKLSNLLTTLSDSVWRSCTSSAAP